jgi:hypothetical protein
MNQRPRRISQFNVVLSTLLAAVAMERFASRAELGLG